MPATVAEAAASASEKPAEDDDGETFVSAFTSAQAADEGPGTAPAAAATAESCAEPERRKPHRVSTKDDEPPRAPPFSLRAAVRGEGRHARSLTLALLLVPVVGAAYLYQHSPRHRDTKGLVDAQLAEARERLSAARDQLEHRSRTRHAQRVRARQHLSPTTPHGEGAPRPPAAPGGAAGSVEVTNGSALEYDPARLDEELVEVPRAEDHDYRDDEDTYDTYELLYPEYPPPHLPPPPLAPAPAPPAPPVRPLAQAVSGGEIRLSPFPPPAPAGAGDGEPSTELWRRFGASPAEAAANLVGDGADPRWPEHLTQEEKEKLLRGFGWDRYSIRTAHFVGSVAGVPRLNIPTSNMQDAAQGFRTQWSNIVGQVTSFPSALAAGATWDPTLVYEYAAAIGAEFRAKGANVILGPSVNVHRVPRNGRNGEYLSGEDAALGAPLAAAYVRGVQSQGVACTVKHFVLNQQETNRHSSSSDTSDRVLWEVYYPPFKAAVDAGVASVMCGYNLLNGTPACGSHRHLVDHLRGKMGFGGWVMTDWWALNKGPKAATGGVDQELPGTHNWGGDGYFTPGGLASVGADVDGMARRVLTGMFMSGAYDQTGSPSPRPTCTTGVDCSFLLYQAVATKPAHAALARRMAGAATVLLKNENATLPVRRGAKVAVLGHACDAGYLPTSTGQWDAADYYTIGGSGRVLSTDEQHSTVLAGLQAAQASGAIRLRVTPSNDVGKAIEAMRGRDVGVVCGGAGATEGTDRRTLKLDQHAYLHDVVRAANLARQSDSTFPPLVVVALAPGQIIADWAAGAQAALVTFLNGQETGVALADVLLGAVNPSAKLPVTLYNSEQGTVLPSNDATIPYTEGLKVGWRAFIGKPVAFPFGHGLSYSAFEYAWAPRPAERASSRAELVQRNGEVEDAADEDAVDAAVDAEVAIEIEITVTNVGVVAGSEVAQLYLRYPKSAGEPDLVLRDFRKTTTLEPGEGERLKFTLSSQALSVWRAMGIRGGFWYREQGEFTAVIGSSSRDVRLSHAFAG